MLIFIVYFTSAFLTYAVLRILYHYEITREWKWQGNGVMLCVIKGMHWGASMQIDAWTGPWVASLICAPLFHGLQQIVDLKMANKPLPRPWYRLWYRSYLSFSEIIDSYVHLTLFHGLEPWIGSAAWRSVVGHLVGLFLTYPAVAIQRRQPGWYTGVFPYAIRSSLASFFIALLASYWIVGK